MRVATAAVAGATGRAATGGAATGAAAGAATEAVAGAAVGAAVGAATGAVAGAAAGAVTAAATGAATGTAADAAAGAAAGAAARDVTEATAGTVSAAGSAGAAVCMFPVPASRAVATDLLVAVARCARSEAAVSAFAAAIATLCAGSWLKSAVAFALGDRGGAVPRARFVARRHESIAEAAARAAACVLSACSWFGEDIRGGDGAGRRMTLGCCTCLLYLVGIGSVEFFGF